MLQPNFVTFVADNQLCIFNVFERCFRSGAHIDCHEQTSGQPPSSEKWSTQVLIRLSLAQNYMLNGIVLPNRICFWWAYHSFGLVCFLLPRNLRDYCILYGYCFSFLHNKSDRPARNEFIQQFYHFLCPNNLFYLVTICLTPWSLSALLAGDSRINRLREHSHKFSGISMFACVCLSICNNYYYMVCCLFADSKLIIYDITRLLDLSFDDSATFPRST